MQFRIFNKNFLLKAFLEYFCMCSAEHSCPCRGRSGFPSAGTAPVHVRNKLWALGAAAGSVLVRDGARVVNAGTACVSLGCVFTLLSPGFATGKCQEQSNTCTI